MTVYEEQEGELAQCGFDNNMLTSVQYLLLIAPLPNDVAEFLPLKSCVQLHKTPTPES